MHSIPFPTAAEVCAQVEAHTYSVAEVAIILGVPAGVVRTAIAEGQIPAIRVGRSWRVPAQRLLDEVLGDSRRPTPAPR